MKFEFNSSNEYNGTVAKWGNKHLLMFNSFCHPALDAGSSWIPAGVYPVSFPLPRE
jgi:hypothetical protein